tara:strand:+ start:210 stop:467 length:258 start_codon:yes stop_codon:yes gene_type:complete
MEEGKQNSPSRVRLDKSVFWISLIVLVLVCGVLVIDPKGSLSVLSEVLHFMTHDLGWLFLVFVFGGVIWLIWLALSRHGEVIRFG